MFKYRLTKILLGVIVILVVLHVIWQVIAYKYFPDNRVIHDIAGRFGLDDELSIPTWVSSVIAMMAAGLAWHVFNLKQHKKEKTAWALVFLAGLFISVDEVASIHELILQSLHILADFGEGKQSWLSNAWLLVVPLILVGLVLSYRILKDNLPKQTLRNLSIAVAVYLLGAFVVEYLSIPMDKTKFGYRIGAVVLEETFEMVGLLLFLGFLMQHIQNYEPGQYKRLRDIYQK